MTQQTAISFSGDSALPGGAVPLWATSKDGYRFDVNSAHWKLNNDVTLGVGIAAGIEEATQIGFRLTLRRYAEEMSARHARNMCTRFKRYLRDTGALKVSSVDLINWRSILGKTKEHQLGGLKGFLLSWHEYGFPGISDDVAQLLLGWRIKGNEKGAAVAGGCPKKGPYTDIEVAAILNWANAAVVRGIISFQTYAYLLVLTLTARRGVQIKALRGTDLMSPPTESGRNYYLNIPRAKQRGGVFRGSFRRLAIVEDLYLVLLQLHKQSVSIIEDVLGEDLEDTLRMEVPLFLDRQHAKSLHSKEELVEALTGARPDCLHASISSLKQRLAECEQKITACSERTGKPIKLAAIRFRRTRGTKLRREGFGAEVIAELLDHSDVQNVKVYTENTAQEAVAIDRLIGSKLAPFAQACLGRLVASEKEAIRGGDPRSRVPNQNLNTVGTCGNYGFCASGYRACYTCYHFQPWLEGPHQEVLEELYAEKKRVLEAGCATEVVNANDPLILAVEYWVALCQKEKTRLATVSTEVD